MTKQLLSALIALALAGTIGCSSSKVDKDKAAEGADTEMAAVDGADGGDEFGDEELSDGGDLAEGEDASVADDGDEFADEGGDQDAEFSEDTGSEVAEGDEFAEDDFGDEVEEQVADLGDETTSDAMAEEPIEEPLASEDTMGTAEPAPLEEYAETTPTETMDAGSDFGAAPAEDPMMSGSMEEPEKTWIPVKKMDSAPYKKRGVLINAIYIARAGDTVSSISNKIYNSDKSDEILNVNPWLNRGIKTGDKVYYNSPKRPNDDSQMMTFYEDAGLSPQTYIAKPGDNLRKVAKELLGEDRSWMEIYATNMSLETKGELPEGTSFRYWPENVSSSGPSMAANAEPPSMDEAPSMDEPPQMEEPPSMPEPSMAQNDSIPPPPEMPSAAGSTLPPPPSEPPPPPMGTVGEGNLAPPPPPRRNRMNNDKVTPGDNMDDMMLMGGVAVILIALISLVIVKRKKSKRSPMDFNTTTHTQIE